MEQHVINVIDECAHGSHAGTMNFPTVIQNLLEVGVAHYHVDFLRAESTYYVGGGQSHIVALPLPDETIAQNFRAQDVAAAVQASQQQGQPFPQFLVCAMRAGCIGYTAYLDGQRVVYGGRLGDLHHEYFPGSPFAPTAPDTQ
ncbi:hypothetical protein IAD21_02171 [Abditibacteriota bacterium]|nr:hypothetical protein IAD21_02171 [Abditibacteriota bacterium]